MPAPSQYSAKQKHEALKFAEVNGIRNAASKYKVSLRTIYCWKRRYDGTIESLENKYCAPYTPHPNAHTPDEIENIKKVLKDNPFISHKCLYEILKKEYGYDRHPGGLYNFLRRNNILPEPQLKNNYATMFDRNAVQRLNGKFLYDIKEILPAYVIEVNTEGIYLASEDGNNSCKLTVYYSSALRFNSEQEAIEFLNTIKNTSDLNLSIKELR